MDYPRSKWGTTIRVLWILLWPMAAWGADEKKGESGMQRYLSSRGLKPGG
jgi:hypothetical protein